ncbi:amidase family protein [Actinomadura nitritigenes]|uniref:amidase family protein n=1 Tax=Actinomadura nitritigenes TaxID=134602 RepID=UPI003D8C835A
MNITHLLDLTALEMGRQLAAGEMDHVSLCEATLAGADDVLLDKVFITLTPERARREAGLSLRRQREGRPRGPLDGVTVAWKDLFDVSGTPTTAGSAIRRRGDPASADAAAVRGLTAAGMVCVGKTNLSEFALSGLGLNPHFGTPRNPHGTGPARIPGGSSSGSAVAVATGAVPCAIGTDTAGSVRAPAAFCGIVGFKATAGRLDRTGVLALAPTFDSIGILARSVADVAAVEAALRGVRPPGVAPSTDASRIRLVIPDGEWVDEADGAVRERFLDAVSVLRRSGADVQRRQLSPLNEAQRMLDSCGSPVAAEAALSHSGLLESSEADLLDPYVTSRLNAGRSIFADGYARLMRERPRLRATLEGELAGAFLVCPTVRRTAPPIEPLSRDGRLYTSQEAEALRNTALMSFFDLPGISLPIGADEQGMPLGLLLSGSTARDAAVLRVARSAEAILA